MATNNDVKIAPIYLANRTQAPLKNVNIRLILFAVFLLIVAWLISPKAARSEVVNRIVAVVGSDIVTERELSKAMSSKQYSAIEARKNPNLRLELLDKLIEDKLFIQVMERSKIEVTDDDLARAIANILHKNGITIDDLKREVAAKGLSYEQYKKQIERDIRRLKFINQVIGPQVTVSDQDLRDYYQSNQGKFRANAEAHIAELVLPLEGITSQAEFDSLYATANQIVSKARKGVNFTSLVKQYSKGPASENGGDVGNVNIKDLPPEIATVVRTMKPNEISNPVVTQSAMIIVKVISLPEIAAGNFEKVRDDIYSAIYDQKVEEALQSYLMRERQKIFVELK